MDNYLEIFIADKQVDLPKGRDLPIKITYQLEDRKDFTKKTGSNALSLVFPVSVRNDRIANTFHNPGIEDLTTGQAFRGPNKCRIIASGQELLVGKAFLKRAGHTNQPTEYEYDFYGNNSDWIIDLKESTLYDFVKHISFIFTKQGIIDSWQFDGTSEDLPYVFAPIRYGNPMETSLSVLDGVTEVQDYNMKPEYMKPSISKYWILYWGFKSLGYKIKSDFLDSQYFRRQVMPWTWGSFLDSDGTKLDVLKFLAKSAQQVSKLNQDFTGFWDVMATNDSVNGAYDNSSVYSYVDNEMRWTYPTSSNFNFGLLEVTLHLNLYVSAVATANSDIEIRVQWFKNGVRIPSHDDNGNGTELLILDAPSVGRREFTGFVEDWFSVPVSQGDTVSAKIYLHTFDSGNGIARVYGSVDAFEVAYFRTPIGGTINFDNYLGFKKYKFLEFLAGVVDEFDLVIQTDTSAKVVYIEPCHPYATGHDLSNVQGGYFNGDFLDWSDKQDLSKESNMEPFTDSERELIFQYKNDAGDGTLKKLQDRESTVVGQAKYLFPERFAVGKKEIENRFFAPTMHYEVKQWAFGSLEAPQMIIMVPENISNLSKSEAQNVFLPKSVYYKGLTHKYKWVFDNSNTHAYPEMFAVNYKVGGHEDPILSYSDEIIGDQIGKGLLRRFYHQRLAIMRNGQYYSTYFKLNAKDIANFLHREFIICRGQKWEVIQIDYNPVKNESSKVIMRKWSPIYV